MIPGFAFLLALAFFEATGWAGARDFLLFTFRVTGTSIVFAAGISRTDSGGAGGCRRPSA